MLSSRGLQSFTILAICVHRPGVSSGIWDTALIILSTSQTITLIFRLSIWYCILLLTMPNVIWLYKSTQYSIIVACPIDVTTFNDVSASYDESFFSFVFIDLIDFHCLIASSPPPLLSDIFAILTPSSINSICIGRDVTTQYNSLKRLL